MNLYNSIQWLLGKVLPESWPWSQGATAKHLVWMVHVLIVAGAVGFAAWLVYALVAGPEPAQVPDPSPESAKGTPTVQSEPPPLPMWVRTLKSLAPLLAPVVSYSLYRYLPEPSEDK